MDYNGLYTSKDFKTNEIKNDRIQELYKFSLELKFNFFIYLYYEAIKCVNVEILF